MLCKENFTKLQRMKIRNQLSQQQKIIDFTMMIIMNIMMIFMIIEMIN